MEPKIALGVIGGSGHYEMPGLESIESREIDTPFGLPSSPVVLGKLEGVRIAFIARHGIGHWLSPSEVNYRANVYAMKKLGVDRLLSVSACGSLREDYAPGDIVIPDQLFDNTKQRVNSFFGEGLVAHINVADPFCGEFSEAIGDSVEKANGKVHRGGIYITVEGPRFSTRAESNVYRSWNMSIIGMTTCPEAFLAREAQICYGVMAHVTDYDVWHVSEESVTVEMVIRTMKSNEELVRRSIVHLVSSLPDGRECECGTALRDALITQKDRIPKETRKKLALLVDPNVP